MSRSVCPNRIISGFIFLAIILTLAFGDAMASECVRCHTKKEKLKTITDILPKKVKSAEISGQG